MLITIKGVPDCQESRFCFRDIPPPQKKIATCIIFAKEIGVHKKTESKFCNDILRFPYYQGLNLTGKVSCALNRNCCAII